MNTKIKLNDIVELMEDTEGDIMVIMDEGIIRGTPNTIAECIAVKMLERKVYALEVEDGMLKVWIKE